jgi:PadR family transcriptional regulator, regulatory protein PadR
MATTETVLLALLYEEDLYGYEIEQMIEDRHMRNWTRIGFSSIYNSLSTLEKKGVICSYYEKEQGSPKRKIYHLMENQKEKVYEMIKALLHSPEREESDFSLGMAFSLYLTRNDIQNSLLIYRQKLIERKKNIQKRYTEQPEVQNKLHLKALFSRPTRLIEAEIEWIDELLHEMKKEKNDY